MEVNKTFTAQMLKTFDECPTKYEMCYLKRIILPSKRQNSKTGEKIHTMANYHLSGKVAIPNPEKDLTEQEQELWQRLKNSEIMRTEHIASEYAFNVRLNEYWLAGRVDAIFKLNSKLIIADWKTGQNTINGEDYQSMIYLYAIYTIFKDKGIITNPGDITFIYFYLKRNEQKIIEYSAEKSESDQKILTTKLHQINTYTTPFESPAKREECYTCNYSALCYNYSK